MLSRETPRPMPQPERAPQTEIPVIPVEPGEAIKLSPREEKRLLGTMLGYLKDRDSSPADKERALRHFARSGIDFSATDRALILEGKYQSLPVVTKRLLETKYELAGVTKNSTIRLEEMEKPLRTSERDDTLELEPEDEVIELNESDAFDHDAPTGELQAPVLERTMTEFGRVAVEHQPPKLEGTKPDRTALSPSALLNTLRLESGAGGQNIASLGQEFLEN